MSKNGSGAAPFRQGIRQEVRNAQLRRVLLRKQAHLQSGPCPASAHRHAQSEWVCARTHAWWCAAAGAQYRLLQAPGTRPAGAPSDLLQVMGCKTSSRAFMYGYHKKGGLPEPTRASSSYMLPTCVSRAANLSADRCLPSSPRPNKTCVAAFRNFSFDLFATLLMPVDRLSQQMIEVDFRWTSQDWSRLLG